MAETLGKLPLQIRKVCQQPDMGPEPISLDITPGKSFTNNLNWQLTNQSAFQTLLKLTVQIHV